MAHAAPGLKVAVSEEGALARVREIVAGAPRGKGEVSLVLGLGAGAEVELQIPGRFAVAGDRRDGAAGGPGRGRSPRNLRRIPAPDTEPVRRFSLANSGFQGYLGAT